MHRITSIATPIVFATFILVNVAATQTVLFSPGDSSLSVTGTTGDDEVLIMGSGIEGNVTVLLNGEPFEFEDVSNVYVDALEGEDTLAVLGTINLIPYHPIGTSSGFTLNTIHLNGGDNNDFYYAQTDYNGELVMIEGTSSVVPTTTGDDEAIVENCNLGRRLAVAMGSGTNDVEISGVEDRNLASPRTTRLISLESSVDNVTVKDCDFWGLELRSNSLSTNWKMSDVESGDLEVNANGTGTVGGETMLIAKECSFNQVEYFGGTTSEHVEFLSCAVGKLDPDNTIFFQMEEGDDELYVEDTGFESSVSIETGAGADSVTFNYLNAVKGSLDIQTGTGADTVKLVEGIEILEDLSIHTASHTDVVAVTNASISGDVRVETARGHDRFTWTMSTVLGDWEAYTGSGVDIVNVEFCKFFGAFYANGGTWLDTGNESNNDFFGSMLSVAFEFGNL